VRAIEWTFKSFDALSGLELYEALALRQQVFVVEQKCAYLDCDGLDRLATHLIGLSEGALVAYARLFPPGVTRTEASFGRIVTHPNVRGTGVGRALVQQAINHMRASYRGPLRISAQCYLVKFYSEFGFVADGEPYDEDGIPHIEMLLPVGPCDGAALARTSS
jgi:ElaA protein